MAETIYHHEEQSRNFMTSLAAALSAGMTLLGLYGGAPWYFFAPVLFALVASLWLIVANRRSGITITQDTIHVFAGRSRHDFTRSEITGYHLTIWSDGPDSIALRFADGREHMIASYCAGPADKLRAALEQIGINRVGDP